MSSKVGFGTIINKGQIKVESVPCLSKFQCRVSVDTKLGLDQFQIRVRVTSKLELGSVLNLKFHSFFIFISLKV